MSTGVLISRKARTRPPALRVSTQDSIESSKPSASIYQITPSIFISGYEASKNIDLLTTQKISHILNLAGESKCPNLYTSTFSYFSLKMPDNPKIDILFFIYFAVDCIQQVQNTQGKILIHCVKGTSRAAAVILAYLILQGYTETEAYNLLISSQPSIDPNLGFVCQLKDLGKHRTEPISFWYSPRYDMFTNTPTDQGCKIELSSSECTLFINSSSSDQEKSRALASIRLWEKFNHAKASIIM